MCCSFQEKCTLLLEVTWNKKAKSFDMSCLAKFLKYLPLWILTLLWKSWTYFPWSMLKLSLLNILTKWDVLVRMIGRIWCGGVSCRNRPEFLWVHFSRRFNKLVNGLQWLRIEWHGLFFKNFHGIREERLRAASYLYEYLLDNDLLMQVV